jgi:hypothetical protein
MGLCSVDILSTLRGETTGQKHTRAINVKKMRDREVATCRDCRRVGRRHERRDMGFRLLARDEYIMTNLVGYSRKMIDITESVLYTFIVR